ncbi:dihydropteroate synthase, partial [Patescibacteria group bacterium]|nr:dihydropteroate synthase [Patescibacteria group bacterium]
KIFKGVISVDTYKAEVAEMAIKAGADMINDVTAGRGDKEMFRTVAKYGAGYCMMYSKDKTARTTRENVQYDDVVRTIFEFLERRIDLAVKAGVKLESICVDPGMGAFVSADSKYSLQLIKNIGAFRALGVPVLVGASRKSFISGVIKDKGPQDRMEGSLIASVMAGLNGADILRVHDAGETVRGIRMGRAINVI